MKHSYFTVLLTVLMSMVANTVSASEHVAEIDGINYRMYYVGNPSSDFAVVTGTSRSGDITIPASISFADYYDGNYREYNFVVRVIRSGAFSNHTDITSISIPNSVNNIESSAFKGCTGLTNITIPNSVTNIGYSAFQGCTGLTSISIPNSVSKIGDDACTGCSGLTSIVVEQGNPNYDSRNNCNAIIETKSNTLIYGCKRTVIPNNVTSVGYAAFSFCSGLTSITIPSSVTSIGFQAFYGCSGLTSITIPNSVTSIGGSAFGFCI